MRLALIGGGAMGRLVAALAHDEGCEVGHVVTSREAGLTAGEMAERLRGHDAAVDFSVAEAVGRNVAACVAAGVPLVEGTTGWLGQLGEVRREVERGGGALVYGANFSIGVNLFYRLVARAAELFASPGYEVFIEEAHHSRKRDAPSGTALRLRDIVAREFGEGFSVASTRAGHIPGTHRVGFDGPADQVTLTHTARTREGFAAGALAAARFIRARKGVYEFSESVEEILGAGAGGER
ncbi:MAG TPA: dihydrodipicolinate reductase C-terminal domain-containing protein [Pyrinomonadaceae bacterium]|nr:dihydrodipicolinate reductase C-terminal domain-containing protein [Pyrinomonadaceae bacterium]